VDPDDDVPPAGAGAGPDDGELAAEPGVPGAATTASSVGSDESEEDEDPDVDDDEAPVREAAAVDVAEPAKVDDDTGRPSRPITTGESADEDADEDAAVAAVEENVTDRAVPSEPDPTGTARTSAVITVLTMTPSARRPLRCRRPVRAAARACSDERVIAPRIRAEVGGPAGAWCTANLPGPGITIRYREKTNRARKVTVSRRDGRHIPPAESLSGSPDAPAVPAGRRRPGTMYPAPSARPPHRPPRGARRR